MRAKEFIREFTINVPVTINIPLSDILKNSPDIINPGVRYGEQGDAKWSPPLQQHLDTVKDSVGPTTADVTTQDPQDDYHTPQQEITTAVAEQNPQLHKDNAAVRTTSPSVLG
jgi:hypothetical protein